jgi:hypothetical protein
MTSSPLATQQTPRQHLGSPDAPQQGAAWPQLTNTAGGSGSVPVQHAVYGASAFAAQRTGSFGGMPSAEMLSARVSSGVPAAVVPSSPLGPSPPFQVSTHSMPSAPSAAWSAGATGWQPVRHTPPEWARLLYTGHGVLVDDARLHATLSVSRSAPHARGISLTLGNRLSHHHGAAANFEALTLRVARPGAAALVELGAAPAVLLAQQHAAVGGVAYLSGPPNAPATPPVLAISFQHGGQWAALEVPLPLLLPTFAEPNHSVQQASFFAAWGQAAQAPGCAASESVRLPRRVPSGAALAQSMASLGFSDGGARLDPTSELNFAGSCHSGPATGEVLVRVEVNPAEAGEVHVTAVSPAPGLALVFRDWVTGGLAHLASGWP